MWRGFLAMRAAARRLNSLSGSPASAWTNQDCRLPPEAARCALTISSLTIARSTGLSRNQRQEMRQSTASKTSMGMTYCRAAALFSRTHDRCKADDGERAERERHEGHRRRAGQVPERAADDRHDHGARVADGEHAARGRATSSGALISGGSARISTRMAAVKQPMALAVTMVKPPNTIASADQAGKPHTT